MSARSMRPFESRRFDVVSDLGAGGMGVVYAAVDKERGERVALKTIRDPAPNLLVRFKNEFRALHDVRHPNLVSLGELYEENGSWFFTMELVEGDDFLTWVRREDSGEAAGEATSPGALGYASTEVRAAAPLSEGICDDATDELPIAPVRWNERRLREGLLQLARGLAALHAAQRVHRDVKPANVLVTPKGRVVLLDFGLVSQLERAPGLSEVEVVGTAAYMAPEQTNATRVGPEADWYSVGALLFEAMTGTAPFTGPHLEVLVRKRREPAPRAKALNPDVPDDLDALCAELLSIDPAERPTAREVLVRLGDAGGTFVAAPSIHAPAPLFVGRERELSTLRRCFENVGHGRPALVLVRGPSGVGKSALIQQFVSAVREQRGVPPLVFSGRCYEREAVSFKAFDGIVEAIANHLRRLPDVEVAGYLPRRIDLLIETFPLLGIVPLLRAKRTVRSPVVDAHERRVRMFAALRELLERLAVRPIVLVIDDLQWADADSLALLDACVRSPDAPPLCILATERPDREETVSAPRQWDPCASVTTLSLGELDASEAYELATALLAEVPRSASGGRAAGQDRAAHIVAEAGGHPMFINVLAQFAESAPAMLGTRLDDALWNRIEQLSAPARAIVRVTCLAGVPVSQSAIRDAAALQPGEFAGGLAEARAGGFVRTQGSQGTERVEAYHDRVRETVVHHVPADERKAIHRRLAEVLARDPRTDASLLAAQWELAGEPTRAAGEACRAGDAALVALAFQRAIDAYRHAIALGIPDGAERRHAFEQMGSALAGAGEGRGAAEAFEVAATGADPLHAIELRRRAAEQLLLCGELEQGKAALARVLAEFGHRFPRFRAMAIVRYAIASWLLWRRGYAVSPKAEVSPRDRLHVRVLHTAVYSLLYSDWIIGLHFGGVANRLVLAKGGWAECAHVLAGAAQARLVAGDLEGARALLSRAEAAVNSAKDAAAVAVVKTASATTEFVRGRWKSSLDEALAAEQLYLRTSDATRTLAYAREQIARAAHWVGDLTMLHTRATSLARDAIARNDMIALACTGLGFAGVAYLQSDSPDQLLDLANHFRARWDYGDLTWQTFSEERSRVEVSLYRGDVLAAWMRASAIAKRYRWFFLLSGRVASSVLFDNLRLSAALAAARALTGREKRRACATADAHAKRLIRDRRPALQGVGWLACAARAAMAGDRTSAACSLEQAIRLLDTSESKLYAAAARYRLAQVRGDGGTDLYRDAVAYFEAQRVVNVERFLRVIAPGFEEMGKC